VLRQAVIPADSFTGLGNVPSLTFRHRDAGDSGYLQHTTFARLYSSACSVESHLTFISLISKAAALDVMQFLEANLEKFYD